MAQDIKSRIVVRLWSLAEKMGRYGKFNFLLSDGEYLFAIYEYERDPTLSSDT